jgi:CRISPR-associated endonuclease/helicase Cas3
VVDNSRIHLPLACVLAGHHQGLPDASELKAALREPAHGEALRQTMEALDAALETCPPFPPELTCAEEVDLFTRLIYSALVDADFLDTQRYMADCGEESALADLVARAAFPPLEVYLPHLEAYLGSFQTNTPVNALRAEVCEACVSGATLHPGIFTLTVPTGGGKTLSSLAWALHHARHHSRLRRVVVALPYTTIIDQTAKVFRKAFKRLGGHAVLEHHGSLDPAKESRASRVASENWEAPLIVTTQVQLFESLFSNKPSRCRKLHALQDTILVLDEVQSLPRDLLAPILDVLNGLVRHWGVSVLLMTATQPSLAAKPDARGRFLGLDPAPVELIPSALADRLWNGLRRVETHWPGTWEAPPTGDKVVFWPRLASLIMSHPQALAIVHLKGDAQALLRALCVADSTALHLSSAMAPIHRRAVLREIRHRLAQGVPCRVVSTQVVEAGVDLDFPVVFRAMAGLESLAQSAGRCNREGRLADQQGQFFVFDAPTEPPQTLREALGVARTLRAHSPELDLFVPGTFPGYFQMLHDPARTDAHGIQALRREWCFETVARTFRMIPEETTPVFLPLTRRARYLLDRLAKEGPSRDLLRRLQLYVVSVYPRALAELRESHALVEIYPGFLALVQAPGPHYDLRMGLTLNADATSLLMV